MIFYHVSDNKDLDKTSIIPKVPTNQMNSEPRNTKRICVSSSIIGCLSGRNCKKDEILYVYKVEADNFYQPSTEEVIDSPLTGEIWLLEEVNFNIFSKIKIIEVIKNDISNMPFDLYKFEFIN